MAEIDFNDYVSVSTDYIESNRKASALWAKIREIKGERKKAANGGAWDTTFYSHPLYNDYVQEKTIRDQAIAKLNTWGHPPYGLTDLKEQQAFVRNALLATKKDQVNFYNATEISKKVAGENDIRMTLEWPVEGFYILIIPPEAERAAKPGMSANDNRSQRGTAGARDRTDDGKTTERKKQRYRGFSKEEHEAEVHGGNFHGQTDDYPKRAPNAGNNRGAGNNPRSGNQRGGNRQNFGPSGNYGQRAKEFAMAIEGTVFEIAVRAAQERQDALDARVYANHKLHPQRQPWSRSLWLDIMKNAEDRHVEQMKNFYDSLIKSMMAATSPEELSHYLEVEHHFAEQMNIDVRRQRSVVHLANEVWGEDAGNERNAAKGLIDALSSAFAKDKEIEARGIIVDHLAALVESTIANQARLEAELDRASIGRTVRADKQAGKDAEAIAKASDAESGSSGSTTEQAAAPKNDNSDVIAERELTADRQKLIDLLKNGLGDENSNPLIINAVAHAVMTDAKARDMAIAAGLKKTVLLDAAAEHRLALEKGKGTAAPSQSALLSETILYVGNEVSSLLERKNAGPLTAKDDLALERNRIQLAQNIREYLDVRTKSGATEASVLLELSLQIGVSYSDIKDDLHAFGKIKERAEYCDVVPSAKHAYKTFVPERLQEAIQFGIEDRKRDYIEKMSERSPDPKSVVRIYDKLEAERKQWQELANTFKNNDATSKWATMKLVSTSLDVGSLSLAMTTEPSVMSYVKALEEQGGPVRKGFSDKLNSRTKHFEQGCVDEIKINRDQSQSKILLNQWRMLKQADIAADGFLALKGDKNSGISPDLFTSAARDKEAIGRQIDTVVLALGKTGLEFNDKSLAAIGITKSERQPIEMDLANANKRLEMTKESAVIDIEADANPFDPAFRGRSSIDKSVNTQELLKNGRVILGEKDHFSTDFGDAYLRGKERIDDVSMENGRQRTSPQSKAYQEGLEKVVGEKKPEADIDLDYKERKASRNRKGFEVEVPYDERDVALRQRDIDEKRNARLAVAKDLKAAMSFYGARFDEKGESRGKTMHEQVDIFMDRGIKRMMDKSSGIARDFREAIRARDAGPDMDKHRSIRFGEAWERTQTAKAKAHADVFTGLLEKMVDGRAQDGDVMALQAYSRSHELSSLAVKGLAMNGVVSDKQVRTLMQKLEAPENVKNRNWLNNHGEEVLSSIKIEQFKDIARRREFAYRADDKALATGKNFPEGYVPTREECELARSIARGGSGLHRLIKANLDAEKLREQHPGKSDEELVRSFRGKRQKQVMATLADAQTYETLECIAEKGREGQVRNSLQPIFEVDKATAAEKAHEAKMEKEWGYGQEKTDGKDNKEKDAPVVEQEKKKEPKSKNKFGVLGMLAELYNERKKEKDVGMGRERGREMG